MTVVIEQAEMDSKICGKKRRPSSRVQNSTYFRPMASSTSECLHSMTSVASSDTFVDMHDIESEQVEVDVEVAIAVVEHQAAIIDWDQLANCILFESL